VIDKPFIERTISSLPISPDAGPHVRQCERGSKRPCSPTVFYLALLGYGMSRFPLVSDAIFGYTRYSTISMARL
jgi:hypothetical protein